MVPWTMHTALPIRRLFFLFLASLFSLTTSLSADNPRILIYTRNQVGPGLYVHDNIAQATAAIQKACAEQHIDSDVSDYSGLFTPANLKRYKAVVFNNTNNEILDNEEQKTAFQDYLRHGGGFVGIHSASGSMRNWPWFWSMLGGKFKRHPKLQSFTITVKDREDISTQHLPAAFEWTDEFYYVDNMPTGLHVLLAGDLTKLDDPEKEKYPGKAYGDEFPLAWRHEFEGGRAWYTALGHKGEYYSDPRLIKHIMGGIRWAIGES